MARFVVGQVSLDAVRNLSVVIDTVDLMKSRSILVIADPTFYIDNELEIAQWCDASLTKWTQNGMILGFINDEERTLFLMRWA